ncbi:MAG: hypothetical protein Q4E02_02010 [Lagierella massiliensis]|nr:hypothetical protein [Lagierella massiliensis]
MKTKAYVLIYPLIIFMLLTSIITVLIFGIRMESKKSINQRNYYQNRLIARSIYYKMLEDQNFLQFCKDPKEYKLKEIQLNDIGLNCYRKIPHFKLGRIKDKYSISYKVEYKNTITYNDIIFKPNESIFFNENSKVKPEQKDLDLILENELEKINGDLVFYGVEDETYYINRKDYERFINEIYNNHIKSGKETDEEETLINNREIEVKNLEKLAQAIEILIRDYLDKFYKLEKEYFMELENFTVLNEGPIKLKGICVLKKEGLKEGNISFDGVLINYSDYKNIIVRGKVLEINKFLGKSYTNLDNVAKLKNFSKIDDTATIVGLVIK